MGGWLTEKYMDMAEDGQKCLAVNLPKDIGSSQPFFSY